MVSQLQKTSTITGIEAYKNKLKAVYTNRITSMYALHRRVYGINNVLGAVLRDDVLSLVIFINNVYIFVFNIRNYFSYFNINCLKTSIIDFKI